jgi:hypothetical protein
MDEAWIPIIGMICIFGLPVAGWVTVRYLQHRERMTMLQHGIVPPPQGVFRRNRGWMPPPGYGAPPAAPMAGPYGYEDPNSPQCLLRKGITVTAVGLALLIGLSFIGYHGGDGLMMAPTWHPGPWLLGGLIPMFVGLAQIAIAVLSGATIVVPPSFGRSDVPPPPNGTARPYGSYGAPQPGQPGPRYEELARPVPPPDRT